MKYAMIRVQQARRIFSVAGPWLLLLGIGLGACIRAQGQTDHWKDLAQQAAQLVSQGRYLEALPLAQQGVQEALATFGDASLNYGISLNALGYVQMCLQRSQDAEGNLLKAESVVGGAVGTDNPAIVTTLANLALLYYNEAALAQTNPAEFQRLLAKSEHYAKRNCDLMLKLQPSDSPAQVGPMDFLANVYAAEREYAQAKSLVDRTLSIELANLPPGNVQVIHTRGEIAWLKLQLGDRLSAIADYKETLSLAEQNLGANHPVTISVREALRLAQGGHLDSQPN